MVFAKIKDLELPEDVEILATDWQVSETINFHKIELQELNSTKNKTLKIWPESLDPNKTWYGRARILLTTGWTVWSNLDKLVISDSGDFSSTNDLPTRISIPVLKTSDKPEQHDLTLFTLTAEGFGALGTASHEATTWIIEEANTENIVWASVKDILNKESITINNLLLKDGRIYRVRAMFHATSGDTSEFATITINTAESNDINLLTYLDIIDPNINNSLVISVIDTGEQITEIRWEIVSLLNNYSDVIWVTTTSGSDMYTNTIPSGLLAENGYFLLRITTNVPNSGWKYITFRTSGTTEQESTSN